MRAQLGRRGQRGLLGAGGVTLLALAGCDLGASPTTYPVPGDVVKVADVNGDGHVDVLAWETTDMHEAQLGVLLGDGSGGFTVAPPAAVAHGAPIVIDDLDSDGDVDIVTSEGPIFGTFEVLSAASSGQYTVTTVPHASSCVPDAETSCHDSWVRAAADANGDGHADLFTEHAVELYPEFGPYQVFYVVDLRLADGAGGFLAPVEVARGEGDSGTALVGDVTADGLVDLVIKTSGTELSVNGFVTYVGNGAGGFGAPIVTPTPPSAFGRSRLVDVDEDGYSDILITGALHTGESGEAEGRGVVEVLFNTGTGRFPPGPQLIAADPAVDEMADAAVADVDEDGDLDILTGNSGYQSDDWSGPLGTRSLFRRNAPGGFDPEESQASPVETNRVQVAEFDGDGHLDILLSTDSGSPNRLPGDAWIEFGDGTGAFTDRHQLPGGSGLAADVDADGKADFVRRTDDGIQVFLNRWDGRP